MEKGSRETERRNPQSRLYSMRLACIFADVSLRDKGRDRRGREIKEKEWKEKKIDVEGKEKAHRDERKESKGNRNKDRVYVHVRQRERIQERDGR